MPENAIEVVFALTLQTAPSAISCLSFPHTAQWELCIGRVQPAPLIHAFAGILPLVYGLGNLPPTAS